MPHNLSTESRIVASLRQIIRAVDLHSRRLFERVGLTGPQLAVLLEVGQTQPTSAGVVAKAVHLSAATVVGILNRLESQGLISRRPSKKDRRSIDVSLTKKGRKLVESAPSLLQDRFREQLNELAEWELLMILTTLQRVATLMDAEELDAAPHLVSGDMHGDGKETTTGGPHL